MRRKAPLAPSPWCWARPQRMPQEATTTPTTSSSSSPPPHLLDTTTTASAGPRRPPPLAPWPSAGPLPPRDSPRRASPAKISTACASSSSRSSPRGGPLATTTLSNAFLLRGACIRSSSPSVSVFRALFPRGSLSFASEGVDS